MAPSKGKPFEKGHTQAGAKRKPGAEVVRLADEAAEAILKADLALLRRASMTPAQARKKGLGRKPSKLDIHRAKERVARMAKGRVPTRIAIAGDEGGEPVPFGYVEVQTVARSGEKEGGKSG